MTEHEHDDERALRAAFARLREHEASRAPTLAQLLARGSDARARRGRPWLRFALPLAGASAVALAWWVAAGPLAREPQLPAGAPIALGSLRSPTDVLLAPPLAALPREFSSSLIPAPAPRRDQRSLAPSARRFSA